MCRKLIGLLLVIMSVISSCSIEDETVDLSITVNNGELIPAAACEIEIDVSCDGAWNLSTTADWLDIECITGTGSCRIGAYVSGNEDVGRSGYIQIVSGTQCRSVFIEQSGVEGSVKVLVLGNSFTKDALAHLPGLLESKNLKYVFANLYIGGAGLSMHRSCIMNNKSDYEYTLWRSVNHGEPEVKNNVAVSDIVQDYVWDYIVLQEGSSLAGFYESYFPNIEYIIDYFRFSILPGNTEFVMHQTWAYPEDSDHSGFPNYDNDQLKMYEMTVSAVDAVAKKCCGARVIPTGAAIQNGRSSSLEDTFNRDSNHLNYTYGRFTASCVWYEWFFSLDSNDNDFRLDNMTDKEDAIARLAAHSAIEKPTEITEIKL